MPNRAVTKQLFLPPAGLLQWPPLCAPHQENAPGRKGQIFPVSPITHTIATKHHEERLLQPNQSCPDLWRELKHELSIPHRPMTGSTSPNPSTTRYLPFCPLSSFLAALVYHIISYRSIQNLRNIVEPRQKQIRLTRSQGKRRRKEKKKTIHQTSLADSVS